MPDVVKIIYAGMKKVYKAGSAPQFVFYKIHTGLCQ